MRGTGSSYPAAGRQGGGAAGSGTVEQWNSGAAERAGVTASALAPRTKTKHGTCRCRRPLWLPTAAVNEIR